MGNRSTKQTERDDVTLINNLSQGMDTLRRSSESDGTKRIKMTLESNEQKVQDVLQRSRKGSTRKRALSLLKDLNELKNQERMSRMSCLDNGVVDSNSIIIGDAKNYDRERLNNKNWETLCDVRRKLERLRKSVYGQELATPATYQQIEELRARLQLLRVEGDDAESKQEFLNVLNTYEQKLAERNKRNDRTDGTVASKPLALLSTISKGEQRSKERTGTQPRTIPHDECDELALYHGKVLSLKDECDKFEGDRHCDQYTRLTQSLMRLWDQLGHVKDSQLVKQRDMAISIISHSLKELNRKTIENARDSLSKNKVLALAEVFEQQFSKVEEYLSAGALRESEKVYEILTRVSKQLLATLTSHGTKTVAAADESKLVTARLTPSLRRKPFTIYVSRDNLNEIESDPEQPSTSSIQSRISRRNSANIDSGKLDIVIENLFYEAATLKCKVDGYYIPDRKSYDDLDERLIDLLIHIESVKAKCNHRQEMKLAAIMHSVKKTCVILKKKCFQLQLFNTQIHDEQMQCILNIADHLEIWRTSIYECHLWQSGDPQFDQLIDTLQNALESMEHIEPVDDVVSNQQIRIVKELRDLINRLDAQKYQAAIVGTEV